MKQQIKDTDYIFVSSRIKALERGLLTRERIERMLEATTHEDAAKVLTECGYPELTEITADALEASLAEGQKNTMIDLGRITPDQDVVDLFKLRYDYHNAKVLVKAEALNSDPEKLMLWGGRYDPEQLAAGFAREDLKSCSDLFRRGVARAREVLGATGDPQQADFALDRAYFEELAQMAEATGSKFLMGYAALMVDVANLRAAVRVSRLNKGPEFLSQVLMAGGTVGVRTLVNTRGDELGSVFRFGSINAAAVEGAAKSAPGSGSLTEFERLCDNAVMDYLGDARMVPFGLETVVGYLYARETEVTAIRTIMSGRMAGLGSDIIRQRLRRTYA